VPLTIERILAWADQHYERTGKWPTVGSGEVFGEPGESWMAINRALGRGSRGLPDGSSLSTLLAKHRGVPIHRGYLMPNHRKASVGSREPT